MKVTSFEVKVLIDKYKKEGIKSKDIFKRINNIYEFDDYIKFKNKHSYANDILLTYYPSVYGVRDILLPTFSTSYVPYVRIVPTYDNILIVP